MYQEFKRYITQDIKSVRIPGRILTLSMLPGIKVRANDLVAF